MRGTPSRLLACRLICALACLFAISEAPAQDGARVILDMDTVRHQPGTFGANKTPVGTVALVGGKFGKACQFSFVPDASGGFFTAWVKATPDWDQAAGLLGDRCFQGRTSFRVLEREPRAAVLRVAQRIAAIRPDTRRVRQTAGRAPCCRSAPAAA